MSASGGTPNYGRITAYNNDQLTNNRAYISTGTWSGNALNDKDGLTINNADAETRATYEIDAGWGFDDPDNGKPWIWNDTKKHPVLWFELLP